MEPTETSKWSFRRKALYISIPLGIAFVLMMVLFFNIWFQEPTCFDGRKNSDEAGVDCGGQCERLCAFEVKSPIVLWSRVFRVSAGEYNALAYVRNQNTAAEVIRAPYTFKVFDAGGNMILERAGVAYIPPNQAFGVFEGGMSFTDQVPKTALFEFREPLYWQKSTEEPLLVDVREKVLLRENERPRIDAVIENRSIEPARDVEVVAIVYDSKDNAVGVSRTRIDLLDKQSQSRVTFTWPEPFSLQSEVCKIPAEVMILIDRSGSMASGGSNPPEPLSTVKSAASGFVGRLGGSDKAGLVSFATEPSEPIDFTLSQDFEAVKSAIGKIFIHRDGTQYTNIGDAIKSALSEFGSKRHMSASRKVAVVLTDGMPTKPEKAGDDKFPSTYALSAAKDAKASGVVLYAIGLGGQVDADFMRELASSPDHYYSAADSSLLDGIYEEIATSICKDSPTLIEVIPVVPPVAR